MRWSFFVEVMLLKKATKRIVIAGFVIGMIITSNAPVFADSKDDFQKDEDKYITLCSSSHLSKNQQNTCKKFNTYLKAKNKEVMQDIADTKKEISKTTDNIDEIKKGIEVNEQEMVSLEIDIKQIEKDIEELENTIEGKKKLLGDRLYVMQTLSNSNDFLYFLMGAQDLTTAIRRAQSIKEITKADREEIDKLATQYETYQLQKKSLDDKKKVLKSKKEENEALQEKYEELLVKQQKSLKNSQNESQELSESQKKINTNLTKLFKESLKEQSSTNVGQISKPSGNQSSGSSTSSSQSTGEVGVKIANKALTRQGCRYWWGAPGGGFGDGQGLDNANAIYFDCSGLVAWAHRQSGIMIGRTTAAGYSASGKSVSYSNLQPGDVITFNYGGGVAHIGIYIGVVSGVRSFVHASGSGSGTRGQYANQCVKVSSIEPGGYWYNYMYNCRRLY